MPSISVIIPCFNGSAFLRETIESVRAQSFRDWELIVVDDGSTDNSGEIAASYACIDDRIRLVTQANGGVARARNRGFEESTPGSDYLLFLDADDLLKPEMLERLVGYLEEKNDVGLVHCDSFLLGEDGSVHGGRWASRFAPSRWAGRALPPQHVMTPFVSIYLLAPLIPSLCVIRRSDYEQTPGWNESLGQPCEDTDLFLHIALRSTVHYFPHALVYYRVHATQSTQSGQRLIDQRRKLYAKWTNHAGLTEAERTTVMEAERFRRGRFVVYFGYLGARRQLAEGHYLRALRIFGGALVRMLRQQAVAAIGGNAVQR